MLSRLCRYACWIIVSLFFLLAAIESVAAEPLLLVTVAKKGQTTEIKSVTLLQGLYRPPQHELRLEKSPRVEIIDTSGQVLLKKYFQFPVARTVPMAQPYSGGAVSIPAVLPIAEPEVVLVLPYMTEARNIKVFVDSVLEKFVTRSLDDIHAEFSQRSAPAPEIPSPPPAQQDSFHLLILASGYSAGEMGKFADAANRVSTSLMSFEPFRSSSQRITITPYQNTANLGCYTGCNGIDRLLCCNTTSVLMAAAASGKFFDEIIVVHNTSQYAGGGYREYQRAYQTDSASTYTMVYDGPWTANMAVHEFGHSFGNLCDEYTYGSENYAYTECVNCQPSCSIWQTLSGVCQQSCSARSTYFRPEDSIMLSLDINSFNQASIQAEYLPDGLLQRLQFFTGKMGAGSQVGPILYLLLLTNP